MRIPTPSLHLYDNVLPCARISYFLRYRYCSHIYIPTYLFCRPLAHAYCEVSPGPPPPSRYPFSLMTAVSSAWRLFSGMIRNNSLTSLPDTLNSDLGFILRAKPTSIIHRFDLNLMTTSKILNRVKYLHNN